MLIDFFDIDALFKWLHNGTNTPVKTVHQALAYLFFIDGPRRECTYGPNGLCRLSRGLSNYDCNISKCVHRVKWLNISLLQL